MSKDMDTRFQRHTQCGVRGVWNSESHQRLIKFEFANMNFLVRFEADGYLPDLIPGNLKTQEEPVHIKSHMEPEDLLSSIKAASISIDPSETSEQEAIDLKISKGGRYIPQCAIFDLKTRSVKKEHIDTLSEEMGRLWIRQIPNFILAYHKSGKFDDIRVQDVRENMKQWEESEQPDLQRFATLLQTIISFARSTENERLELEHGADEEVLNIRVPGGIVNSVLPPALADRWNARSGSVTNS
ncbi:hypothetical protein N7468_008715 [Penicillium chermesinum]|uniref:Uncharacterized protein n=1 Tax=Penicillium chermesinum TaxID=63820 RepID=A0A9W9NGI0_9EURO|nr:uncharacterized protein N7468_008715 [Penicillium chermesinum]KAJ5219511.1 hypothetical protein N7468_008715 [Penicillium chermesinum]